MDDDIKEIFKFDDEFLSSMRYQTAVFSLSFIKVPYMLAFDIAWMYFQGPLKLWNFLCVSSATIGLCEGSSGIGFEYLLAPFFMFFIAIIETIIFFGFGWIDTFCIRAPAGFTKATYGQFCKSKRNAVLFQTLLYLPLVWFGMGVCQLFNNNLVIAISIGTIAGKFFMLKLFPILKNRFLEKDAEFPADKTDLKNKIIKLAEELGYDNAEAKIRLYQSASGDLHSNASVDGSKINISYRLLTHHEGKDEELLAILAHELGHWSQMHIYQTIVLDVVYMAVLAIFFSLALNNQKMLTDFGFTQQSLFISIYLFYKVYAVTLDYPIRKAYNWYYQWNERRADQFAFDQGFGDQLKRALLRNYAQNSESIFVDPVHAALQKTHPTLIQRIKYLKDLNPEKNTQKPENGTEQNQK